MQPSRKKKQKSREWTNTCRFITQDQWNTFEKELEKILEILRHKRDKWNDEIICTFSIKPNIEVKVQKSKLSSKHFYKFMGGDNDGIDDGSDSEGSIDSVSKTKQMVYALEFVLDFKLQTLAISSVEETQKYEQNSPLSFEPYTPSRKKYRYNSLDGIKTPGLDLLEHGCGESISSTISPITDMSIPAYNPTRIMETRSFKNSQTSNHSCNKNEVIAETDEELLSPEIYRTIKSKVLKKKAQSEIGYTPKRQEINRTHIYVPTCIEKETDSQENNKSSKQHKDKTPIIDTIKEGSTLPKRCKRENCKNSQERDGGRINKSEESNLDKVRTILERPETPFSSEDGIDKSSIANTSNGNEFDVNMRIKNSEEANPENASVLSTTPPNNNTKKKPKKINHHDTDQIRRSGRSPVKPKRLIEEHFFHDNNKKKLKTQKSSRINEELFGTDSDGNGDDKDLQQYNDDDNNNAISKINPSLLQTPKCEYAKISSSSSTKKKRKHDKSNECEQEKRDINKWLGKKKSNSDLNAATTSKEKLESSKKVHSAKDIGKSGSPQPAEFVMPTKEELENIRVKTKLQQEQNEKLKAELEKINLPPPKKVENLSLKNMSLCDLLATFPDYKKVLDEIYYKNCKKDHIKSYNGLNHCFIIRLMEPQTQYKMLQKLIDVYSNTNSTTQATLYANAMLPEWIIRIYMAKYEFTREEAMQQIKAQDDYQLHIDEQSDNSFVFD